MRVWAVSLSTYELSPASLTTRHSFSSIQSLIDYDGFPHREPFSALPLENLVGRYN